MHSKTLPDSYPRLQLPEMLQISISNELVPLTNHGLPLLTDHVEMVRKKFTNGFGFVMPAVKVRDDCYSPHSFTIKVRGKQVAEEKCYADRVLVCLNEEEVVAGMDLIASSESNDNEGKKGYWVHPEYAQLLEETTGIEGQSPYSYITSHLWRAAYATAHQLLSMQDVEIMLSQLRDVDSVLVENIEDLFPRPVPYIHRVVKGLLKNRISIHDLSIVIEHLFWDTEEGRGVDAAVKNITANMQEWVVKNL